ncbi:MAG TPA: hypothetical protein VLT47_07855 [Anaeromyxobacteraceae bacterium]|nr:hypothetical protein [Anaeromyxobacteraceae bacterium]
MKKLTSILAAAVSLAACQPAAEKPETQYRNALPTSETLTISAPAASDGSGTTALTTALTTTGAGAGTAITATGKSEFAAASYAFAFGVNSGVAGMLWLIHSITWWPATSCNDDSCTWGPGSGDNDLNVFKLVVTRTGDRFDYVLSAARKDTGGTAFLPIVQGYANRGAFAHRGDGQFSVKFDNEALLDHPNYPFAWEQKDFGTLDVRYDTHGELQNEVVWRNAKNNDVVAPDPSNPPRVDVYFDFNANARDLLIAFRTLDAQAKQMTLHTQWQASGEGRADVWYTDANVAPATYTETECWAGQSTDPALNYAQTYDSADAAWSSAEAKATCRGVEGYVTAFPTLPAALP